MEGVLNGQMAQLPVTGDSVAIANSVAAFGVFI